MKPRGKNDLAGGEKREGERERLISRTEIASRMSARRRENKGTEMAIAGFFWFYRWYCGGKIIKMVMEMSGGTEKIISNNL